MSSAETYTVVRRTWLSRKPRAAAQGVVALSFLALLAGCGIYWHDVLGAAEWMPASGEAVFAKGQVWRLWTTLFAHSDIGHLLANSLLFVVLGFFLTGYFGTRVFPLMAFLLGGVTNAFSLLTYSAETHLIGASGIVSWMGGAWLTLYFFLNRQISRRERALRAVGVALLLFAPSETFDPHISHRTHLIGFALGVLWGFYYFERRKAEFRRAEVVETVTDEFNTGPLD